MRNPHEKKREAAMHLKKWLVTALAVFVVYFGLEFLVHGVLLAGLYRETASVWRGEEYMKKLFGFMVLGQAIFAFVFAWIYAKGFEPGKPGLAQGLRFGWLIGLLVGPATGLVWYVVLPIPETLAAAWAVAGVAESLVIGAVAGLIYGP
jgi:hypothetical protein